MIGTTYALGVTLANTPGCGCGSSPTRCARSCPPTTCIAEKTGANDDNVVMAGAHLDSVLAGPGINDNGSGSAAILETAQQIAKLKPQNTLRFAWWGAEESGLVGSTNYVNGLSQAEKDRDRAVPELRHDRLAELHLHGLRRRPVELPGAGRRPGRARSRSRISSSPSTRCAASRTTTPRSAGAATTRRSSCNGIPAGGLFTGAEVPKTAEQQAIWGGTAGAQFDPCYHAACDTFANNNDACARRQRRRRSRSRC